MALEVTGLARLQARAAIEELYRDFCCKFHQDYGRRSGRSVRH